MLCVEWIYLVPFVVFMILLIVAWRVEVYMARQLRQELAKAFYQRIKDRHKKAETAKG